MTMDFLTLTELNVLVGESIRESLPDLYWLMAETSDVRVNQSSGHCYLEFIEKNEHTGTVTAKARGYIWNTTFRMLKPYFEEVTGRQFSSGLKILVRVSIDFHPLYGYGLNVCDIEPAYTLGDMQRQRQQTIARLKEDGVFTLNKELELSSTPQRVAVVTSSTAAGYEDFLEHLSNNQPGFIFYPKLFPAIMQGDQTERSIIAALEKIYEHTELFDVVVIIRGGGATSDLSAFDSYLLSASCAQFPLPVITGIGHERDDTVLDMVAYFRAKTPTAVADYLIQQMTDTFSDVSMLEEAIKIKAKSLIDHAVLNVQTLASSLQVKSMNMLDRHSSSLDLYRLKIRNATLHLLSTKQLQLKEKESFIKLSSPEYVLSKGYSITKMKGKTLKSSRGMIAGDEIETILADGHIVSVIK